MKKYYFISFHETRVVNVQEVSPEIQTYVNVAGRRSRLSGFKKH
jgi:hypothetical protein